MNSWPELYNSAGITNSNGPEIVIPIDESIIVDPILEEVILVSITFQLRTLTYYQALLAPISQRSWI